MEYLKEYKEYARESDEEVLAYLVEALIEL
jgi:hypothetical protein